MTAPSPGRVILAVRIRYPICQIDLIALVEETTIVIRPCTAPLRFDRPSPYPVADAVKPDPPVVRLAGTCRRR
jgi:hypothetical protein